MGRARTRIKRRRRLPLDAGGGWGRRLTRGAAVAASASAGWQVGPAGQRHGHGGAGWAAAHAGNCAREGGKLGELLRVAGPERNGADPSKRKSLLFI